MQARSKRKFMPWLGSLFALAFLTVPQTVQAQPYDPFDAFRVDNHSIEFSSGDTTVVKLPTEVNELQTDLPAPVTLPYLEAPGLRGDSEECDGVSTEMAGRTATNQKMYGYHLRIEWCWGPDELGENVITYVKVNRWGTVEYPVWRFVGHLEASSSGGVGQTYFRYRTRGLFCLGLERAQEVSCLQEGRPWIETTVNADGSWSGTGGNA